MIAPNRISAAVACVVAIIAMVIVDYHLGVLQSPERISKSWFCPPLSPLESFDAAQTARAVAWPSKLVVIVLTLVGFYAVTNPAKWDQTRFAKLTGIVALCAVADGVTTSLVFCDHGIQDEVHPAVRLCAYSYGRVAGVALAKSVQFAGVVVIGTILSRRMKFAVLIAAALLYVWAAYTNWDLWMTITG